MGSLTVTRFASPHEFAAGVEPFLMQHEVHHCLMLGLISALQVDPDLYGTDPYFCAVSDGARVASAALMTPPHALVLSLAEPDGVLELIARDVAGFSPRPTGVLGPAAESKRFAEIFGALSRALHSRARAQRLYRLTEVRHPSGVSGRARRVEVGDAGLLRAWCTAFEAEAIGSVNARDVERRVAAWLSDTVELSGAYLWCDPSPVSLVGYQGRTPNGMRIGPVYTPPEARGRGYASACTAAVSQLLLDGGREFCTLFTDLANPTSNKIYLRIGYEPVCDVDEYRFVER